ncbi:MULTISPECIES: NAD-binding protein [unclassified Luteococcus]|uniref:NAD-binding protein n=1 Tax=unclassified Luteococcus TaxID=2639923 RepID=UPI00313AB252
MATLVVGASSTSIRLADELCAGGEHARALVLPGQPEWMVEELRQAGAAVIVVDQIREHALAEAGIDQMQAVVVLGLDEMTTVRVALMVEELNPEARIVLELDNPAFGRRLEPLLGSCTVLSAAALAAPSFVAAAFPGGLAQPVMIGGRQLSAGRVSRVGGELVATLGEVRSDEDDTVLQGEGNVVLGTRVISTGPRARQRGWWGALVALFDRRLRWVVATLVALVIASTVFFHEVARLDWLTSLYVALTASTLTGMGEDFSQLPIGTRLVGIVIQLAGVLITSGITAVITDVLISSRLSALTSGLRGRPRRHYVVVGLGRVGLRVARGLKERGLSVVAIEQSEDAVGVPAARAARIPVLIGDSVDDDTLRRAGVEHADCLVTVTDSDAANLQIALSAHALNPQVRVVTRMFDDDLAGRVERQLGTGPTRSVSRLAAPAFAAAALGRHNETVVPVGRRVVILGEIDVQRPTTVGAVTSPGNCRVLAVRPKGSPLWTWKLHPGDRLEPGDLVAVAASRAGMGAAGKALTV